MGNEEYEWGNNYIQDILMQIILNDNDLLDESVLGGVSNIVENYLYMNGVDPNDAKFMDYYLEREGSKYMIKAGNIVSGMWLTGYFPENPNLLFEKNRVIFDGKIFKYNKKTKAFTWELK